MADKKVVVITGASGGIGNALCRLYCEVGWQVIGVDVTPVHEPVVGVRYVCADITVEDAIMKLVENIQAKEKRIDVLINNAAQQVCKPILETSLDEWNAVFAVNVTAAFLLSKATYKLLRKSSGSIVNIVSVHSFATSKDIAAYAASKGALLSLTRNTALEYAEADIRVNAVAPGAVDTLMLRAGLHRWSSEDRDVEESIVELGKKHALGRVGEPHEIARAVYFLSDNQQSSFITGQVLTVDGGVLCKLATE